MHGAIGGALGAPPPTAAGPLAAIPGEVLRANMSVAQLLLGNEWVDGALKGLLVLGDSEADLLLAAAYGHCLGFFLRLEGNEVGVAECGALIVVLRASTPTQPGDTY